MPILTAHLSAGFSTAQKTALLEQSSDAVVEALNTPLRTVRIMLQEYAADSAIVAGELGATQLVYVAYLIEGRTPELKAALIAALSAAAHSALGISTNDIRVVIRDIPKTDIGLAGGITALAAGR